MSCVVLLVAACSAHDDRVTPSSLTGNPYSFYGSVAECAAAQRHRCDNCLADGTCTAITDLGDGDAECAQLAADDGRGYSLICVNLALAIDAVASCAASRARSCPRDTRASESISSLEANAGFLDDPACAAPLDTCLARLYGAPRAGSPGSPPPPRHTSIDCSDSCSGDSNCDDSPGCELDISSEDSCSDSGDSSSSSCEDSGDGGAGGDPGGDSCASDSEDSCGSQDNSSCDSSDGGGDCGGDSGGGGDCGGGGGGGGDCGGGGGGGDCGGGGGGGDCGGGGGGDCNVAARHGRAGASLPIAIAWALLPIPFATIVRRRAERRRARAAWAEDHARADGEDQP